MLSSGEGRHQHNERALRQMEIGYQGVRHFKTVAGVDINIGPAALGLHAAVLSGPGLQRPARGGAHANAPPSGGLGPVD